MDLLRIRKIRTNRSRVISNRVRFSARMEYKKSFSILGLLVVLSIAGCNRPVDEPPAQKGVSSQVAGNVYPHSLEFRTTRVHGEAFSSDRKTCLACHGSDLAGGTSKVSCTQCHSQFHFADSFKKPDEHGKAALAAGNSACLICHNGKSTKASSCNKCHNYPHTSHWFSPQNHGQAFMRERAEIAIAGKREFKIDLKKKMSDEEVLRISEYHLSHETGCVKCHGTKSEFKTKYPDKFVDCASCHTEMPHSDDFDHSRAALTQYDSCVKCHTNYQRLPGDEKPPVDGQGCSFGGCHSMEEKPVLKGKVEWEKPPQAIINRSDVRSLSSDTAPKTKK